MNYLLDSPNLFLNLLGAFLAFSIAVLGPIFIILLCAFIADREAQKFVWQKIVEKFILFIGFILDIVRRFKNPELEEFRQIFEEEI